MNSNFQLLLDAATQSPSRRSELRSMIDCQQIVEPQFRLELLLLGTDLLVRLRKRSVWRSHVFCVRLYAVSDKGNATELCTMTGDDDLEIRVFSSTTGLQVKMTDTLERDKVLVWKLYSLVVPCDEVCAAIPYRIRGEAVPPPPAPPPPPPTEFELRCLEREEMLKCDFSARVRGAKLRNELRQHPEFECLDEFQQEQTLDSVDRAFDPAEMDDE